ncbi:MAG: hypothetical protein RLZZ628_2190 [Bacteroidota bacterium]|jgi:hypothetical protein
MDVQIQRISQIGTDFFNFSRNKTWDSKNPYQSVKSVESVHPFVSQFFKSENYHNCILTFGKIL